jgi:hypothetical protein
MKEMTFVTVENKTGNSEKTLKERMAILHRKAIQIARQMEAQGWHYETTLQRRSDELRVVMVFTREQEESGSSLLS